MKIYLAGKIRHRCWRHKVVSGLRSEDWMTGEHPGERWPVLENAVVGGFDYAGPYFSSCDHGCAHRQPDGGRHGLSAEPCVRPAPRAVVRDLCLAAIEQTEIAFAWIDTADCYGTIAELGYACAMGKLVVVAFAEGFAASDMWFIQACAHLSGEYASPADALRHLRDVLDHEGATALLRRPRS